MYSAATESNLGTLTVDKLGLSSPTKYPILSFSTPPLLTVSVQIQDYDNSHPKGEEDPNSNKKTRSRRTCAILTKHPLGQRDTEPDGLFAIWMSIFLEIFPSYIVCQRLVCRSNGVSKEEDGPPDRDFCQGGIAGKAFDKPSLLSSDPLRMGRSK